MCQFCGNPSLAHPNGFVGVDSSAADTGSSSSAPKPVGSTAQLAGYLVTGFWQYNNTIAHHWSATTITYNISGLNAAEQFLAQSALNAWHEVANVNFMQTSGAANITFTHAGTMTAYETDQYNGSGIMSSATINISADWITTDGGANDGKTGIDSYGYQTYIHEIGHALGLGHQGPYNGSASYSANATYANDTWQYSVMSYFSQANYNGGSYRYVVTPQMADIYAVASIYGAASATRSGDTVYGFHSTAGSIFDFAAYTQAPALTIYDSGGNNTLDCSGYSANQTIDLHAGSFSSVGGLVRNIGIATSATIRTAIAGSGNDTLIANDLGCTLIGGSGSDILIGGNGKDTFIAGGGVDTMTGGGGADSFVFADGHVAAVVGQRDLVTDFATGTDKIDLSGIDANPGTPGFVDTFSFLGTAALNGIAGALDYFFDSSRGATVLQGDTNGDRVADFAIDLGGNISLTAADLIGASRTTLLQSKIGDFNNDGNDDTLVRESDGSIYEWQMSGSQFTTSPRVSTLTLDWHVQSVGDFNGDGKSDILLRNDSGQIYNWQMNGSTVVLSQPVGMLSLDWHVQGIGDFNGDSKSDILLRNDSGQVYNWQMNGSTVMSSQQVSMLPLDWHIQGIGDFNGDSKSDILLRNDSGQVYNWQMNGSTVMSSQQVSMLPLDWHIQGVGDFNGDGKSDMLLRNDSGQIYQWLMDGSQAFSSQQVAMLPPQLPSVDHYFDLIV